MWVKQNKWKIRNLSLLVIISINLGFSSVAHAASSITQIPDPTPIPNSYGLEATKTQPAPTTGATITIPGSGSSFSTSPTTVSGICPTGLLVEVYDNGVMVGSAYCTGGSFSVQVTLFSGQNDLTASVFDSLDQTGPASNTVTVNYNNASFAAFGSLVTLTSNYGRRAANPGSTLTWPIEISGGSGPYAISINWGDNSSAQLMSLSSAGTFNISHVYNSSGIYHVTINATDSNGVTAFLQVIAVSNGNVNVSNASTPSATGKQSATTSNAFLIPAGVSFAMLLPTYWLGRRSELVSLRKHIEKEAAKYQEK